ncbi:MAG TPA: DUF4190 domain-containing protein [Candidatus Acidoferrum sp.]|nr:DUF4190 domain-containing protein [Candidatus Acidoferrum sp.]
MYTLRGADHQEHGPLSARDVRDWISSGRANNDTEARADNEPAWRPLSQFVEFGPALQITAAANSPPALPAQKPNRIMAIAAFAVSFIPLIMTLPALALGIVALVFAKKKPQQFGGRKFAIAAIAICVFWIVGIPSAIYFGLPRLQRSMYRDSNCYTHARSLATSLRIISIGNNGTYPSADSWCDAISNEVTSTNHYQCPDDPKRGICGFAYNEKLSGVKNPDPNTVMIFESDLGWNGSGSISNVVATPRHNGQIAVGFANGQIRRVKPQALKSLRWDP